MDQIFKIISIVMLITSCPLEQQITYPEYYKAFRQVSAHLDGGEITLALSKFDKIKDRIPHIPSSHLFKIARVCAENNHCELASEYLKLSFENGREYGKGTGAHKTITGCQNQIAAILEQEAAIHDRHFNYEYKLKIDSMFEADQAVRFASDYDEMKIIDSIHMFTLLKQIGEFGYPGEKLIGQSSAFAAFIMLLHMDRDRNNKVFKPILDEAYNAGDLWPSGYAWIVDRRRAWGEESLEPYYYHMPSKNYASFNKEQVDEINRRRDSIGLAPK